MHLKKFEGGFATPQSIGHSRFFLLNGKIILRMRQLESLKKMSLD
jgi:hypothetical protein